MLADSTTGCHKKLYYNSMFIVFVFVECWGASPQDVLQDTQQQQQPQQSTQHGNRFGQQQELTHKCVLPHTDTPPKRARVSVCISEDEDIITTKAPKGLEREPADRARSRRKTRLYKAPLSCTLTHTLTQFYLLLQLLFHILELQKVQRWKSNKNPA